MIRESIAVLCKSSLFYESELSIEGLLGITLDGADVVLVNIREVFRPVDTGGGERTGDVRPVTACRRGDSPPPAAKPVTACRHGDSPPPAKCRRRRRSPTPPPAAVTADSISEPDCVVIKDEADDADWAGDSSVVDSYLGAAILQPEEFKTERMGGINAGSELPTTADDRLPQVRTPSTRGLQQGSSYSVRMMGLFAENNAGNLEKFSVVAKTLAKINIRYNS